MKIFYLFNSILPNEFASSRQVLEMCKAFKKINYQVYLFTPSLTKNFKNRIKRINHYYHISQKNQFIIKLTFLGKFYYLIPSKLKNLFKVFNLFFHALFFAKQNKPQYVYIRNWELIPLLILIKKKFHFKVIFEVHNIPCDKYEKTTIKLFFKKLDLVIFLNNQQRKMFKRMDLFNKNFLVLEDGVDLSKFSQTKNKKNLRNQFNLPQSKKIIGYVGRLESWGVDKGINFLIDSIVRFYQSSNRKDVFFLIVGGPHSKVKYYQKKVSKLGLKNIIKFTGQIEYKLVPDYLTIIDLLLLPQPTDKHFGNYASPLKLFEYMASKTPIIATKTASITHVLNRDYALMVKARDKNKFSQAINFALNNPQTMSLMASNAYNKVQEFSWVNRVKLITDYFND